MEYKRIESNTVLGNPLKMDFIPENFPFKMTPDEVIAAKPKDSKYSDWYWLGLFGMKEYEAVSRGGGHRSSRGWFLGFVPGTFHSDGGVAFVWGEDCEYVPVKPYDRRCVLAVCLTEDGTLVLSERDPDEVPREYLIEAPDD